MSERVRYDRSSERRRRYSCRGLLMLPSLCLPSCPSCADELGAREGGEQQWSGSGVMHLLLAKREEKARERRSASSHHPFDAHSVEVISATHDGTSQSVNIRDRDGMDDKKGEGKR